MNKANYSLGSRQHKMWFRETFIQVLTGWGGEEKCISSLTSGSPAFFWMLIIRTVSTGIREVLLTVVLFAADGSVSKDLAAT